MTPPDVLDLLEDSPHPGVAVEDADRHLGYAELDDSIRLLAGALTRRGVSPGDRVAVMLPNCVAAVQMYLACNLIGAIWVGLNPAAPAAERDRQCALVRPTLIVTTGTSPWFPLAGRALDMAALDVDSADPHHGGRPDPTTPCAIGFSSGTTGTPKAFVHSRAAVSLAAAVYARAQLHDSDRVGVVLPMSIHNLIVVGVLPALFAGATCVAVDQMGAAGVAAACRERRLTILNALVPATIYDLVHDCAVAADALASLRFAGTGAAGLADSLRSEFEAKFAVRLAGSYGLTEAPAAVCTEDPATPHTPGSSGYPLPHVEVVARDPIGNEMARPGEGELYVRARQSGEWAGRYRPAIGTWSEHGLQLREGPGLRTGDYGWIDLDGAVHVSGRSDDVLVRGGVNVNAAELEYVLRGLPGVREVAVIGTPDERLGQRIIAYVEPAGPTPPDPRDLRQRARGMLAHGKVPDAFVVAVLPRNAMGKVSRALLRGPDS